LHAPTRTSTALASVLQAEYWAVLQVLEPTPHALPSQTVPGVLATLPSHVIGVSAQ
jgi:hypothetical protein